MKKFGLVLGVVCLLGLFVLSLFAGNAEAADVNLKPEYALPVYEEKLTEDVPPPTTIKTWVWGNLECLNSVKADPRLKKEGWTLERKLRFIKDLGCDSVCYREGGMAALDRSKIVNGPVRNFSPYPSFEEFLNLAEKIGLNVWIFANWNARGVELASRPFLESHYTYLDALAELKKKHPNLIGWFWDEIWCGEARNARINDVERFRKFCKKEFAESYPRTKMPSQNPSDKWWRRFVVYRYCIAEGFQKALYQASRDRGLKVLSVLFPASSYRNGWKWGNDIYRLSKFSDYIICSTGTEMFGNFWESSVVHIQKSVSPHAFSMILHGRPITHFSFQEIYLDRKETANFRECCRLADEWRGAKRSAEVALLTYPVAMTGLFRNPSNEMLKRDRLIRRELGRYFATDVIDTRDARLYGKYQVLVLPRYAAYSVPEFVIDGLKEFVRKGGTIISLDTRFAVGRRDLTNPRPKTSAITGLRLKQEEPLSGKVSFSSLSGLSLALTSGTKAFSVEKVSNKVKEIASCNGRAVGFEYSLGKGKVISLYLDFARQLKEKPAKYGYLLSKLICSCHQPSAQTEGGVRIMNISKKDGRIGIGLYAAEGAFIPISTKPTDVPEVDPTVIQKGKGKVKVNLKALGIDRSLSQVFRLSDYSLQTCGKKKFWTAAELAKGIPVEIKEAGFENLIIESAGNLHKDLYHPELAAAKQAGKDLIEGFQKKPLGLRKEPFRTRITVERTDETSALPWIENAERRVVLTLKNPMDCKRAGEPIILNLSHLKQAGETGSISESSLRVYKQDGKNVKEMPSQVLDWTAGRHSEVGDDDDRFDKDDELVFVADLPKKSQSKYLLYWSAKGSEQPGYKGIVFRNIIIDQTNYTEYGPAKKPVLKGACSQLQTGKLRILMARPWLFIYPKDTDIFTYRTWGTTPGNPGGARVKSWVSKGPVYAQVELEGKSRKGDKLHQRFIFFANSPWVYTCYIGDMVRKTNAFYWPAGQFPKKKIERLEMLTNQGWQRKPFSGLKKFVDNTKTVIRYRGSSWDGWHGFAYLLASSNIAGYPGWLIEGAARSYMEFAEAHIAAVFVDHPRVEWIYREGVTNKEEMENAAQMLSSPLVITAGAVEKK